MDTVRVNIAYRPLRICWAIKAGDFNAFREAVTTNHAIWGGRFNPVVIVDLASEARAIIEAFRADVILPLGDSEEVKAFAAGYKHLISPFFHDKIFIGQEGDAHSNVLDVQNAMVHSSDEPGWLQVKEMGPRIYKWAQDDPLADILLMQLGAYPAKEAIHIDYETMFKEFLGASEVTIEAGNDLPAELFDHPSIAYLSRHRLIQHYGIQSHWDHHGFYVGDASNLQDLVTFWNLRAANISLLFVDRAYVSRYANVIPPWRKHTAELLSHRRHRDDQNFAIWWRREKIGDSGNSEDLRTPFGNEPCIICGVDEYLWNGLNLKPPMMHFSEVASVNFSNSLYGMDNFTLSPPYVPELNEFYARSMHFQYDRLRIESERIGLVVDAADTDSFIFALSTAELFKQIFALANFKASVSSSGLITRQLISQLGGLQGARVFKVPGARRLLKTHGPTTSFAKRAALQLIGGRDLDNPTAKFEDHKNLYLAPRESGENLTADHVFSYLVEKRLFRIGGDLKCPRCQLRSWFTVDDLRQQVTCQMCGDPFDATDQLIDSEWAYRRSGILGAERNAQGAVPVALTLQQLDANLGIGLNHRSYSVSLDLIATKGQLHLPCEVDFAWLMPRPYPERTIVLIGECKDRGQSPAHGGDGGTINANDISNLRAVADSFPTERFEVYIVLAKLCDFTPDEIELARTLNTGHQLRVILLTERELEPYHFFERAEKLFKIEQHASSAKDIARATVSIFLDPQLMDEPAPTNEGQT
ncbi:MAG: hypothetical protein ACXWT7_08690 [Methylophilaceae bacterium]